jgi:hypothetical protein
MVAPFEGAQYRLDAEFAVYPPWFTIFSGIDVAMLARRIGDSALVARRLEVAHEAN